MCEVRSLGKTTMNKPKKVLKKYSGQQGSYVSGQVHGKNNNEQTKKLKK
jgi:hypothetical protein